MTPEQQDRLRPIGFTPLIAQGLAQLDAAGTAMRVTEVHRDSVVLHDGDHESRGQALPALARTAALADPAVMRHIGDQPIRKFVYVPGKLVNVVV